MTDIIDQLQDTYNRLNRDTIDNGLLEAIYDTDIEFIDPLHHIHTLDALKRYFKGMYQNVTDIEFEFKTSVNDGQTAFVHWDMTFVHPKLNKGFAIVVPGTSMITHRDGKITRHQDFFDSTHLIFDHIPVLNRVLSFLKNRMN